MLFAENEMIYRTWFDINFIPGINFKNKKASTGFRIVCTSCSVCKVKHCQSLGETFRTSSMINMRTKDAWFPTDFFWGWLTLMSKQARSMNEAFHFLTMLIMAHSTWILWCLIKVKSPISSVQVLNRLPQVPFFICLALVRSRLH